MAWQQCPVCGGPAELVSSGEGTTHMRTRERQELDELRAALRRAHDALDVEHGHTGATWDDRQRWSSSIDEG